MEELRGIGVFQSNRVLAPAFVLTKSEKRRNLQEHHQARDGGELLLQLSDDNVRLRTVRIIFQSNEQEARILAAHGRSGTERLYPWVLADNGVHLFCQALHFLKGSVLGRLRASEHEALID